MEEGRQIVKKRSSSRKRPWSDLPQELLELILIKLCYIDQIRFRAVCSRWLSMYLVPCFLQQLPMLMVWYKQPDKSSTILDPMSMKSFTIKDACIKGGNNIKICASKYGWLLMCKEVKHKDDQGKKLILAGCKFFFFNPFTSEVIHLPFLKKSSFTCATFTSPPTSSDCLVFNLYSVSNRTIISTYNLGDRRWISSAHAAYNFKATIRNIVFKDGDFYCYSCSGRLGIYSPTKRTWTEPNMQNHFRSTRSRTYMVEYGGELLLVIKSKKSKKTIFHRLDYLQRKWIRVRSIQVQDVLSGNPTSITISNAKTKRDVYDRVNYNCLKSKNKYSSLASLYRAVIRHHCPNPTPYRKKVWVEWQY